MSLIGNYIDNYFAKEYKLTVYTTEKDIRTLTAVIIDENGNTQTLDIDVNNICYSKDPIVYVVSKIEVFIKERYSK